MNDDPSMMPIGMAMVLGVLLFVVGLVVGIFVIPQGHDPPVIHSVTHTIHGGDIVHCECP